MDGEDNIMNNNTSTSEGPVGNGNGNSDSTTEDEQRLSSWLGTFIEFIIYFSLSVGMYYICTCNERRRRRRALEDAQRSFERTIAMTRGPNYISPSTTIYIHPSIRQKQIKESLIFAKVIPLSSYLLSLTATKREDEKKKEQQQEINNCVKEDENNTTTNKEEEATTTTRTKWNLKHLCQTNRTDVTENESVESSSSDNLSFINAGINVTSNINYYDDDDEEEEQQQQIKSDDEDNDNDSILSVDVEQNCVLLTPPEEHEELFMSSVPAEEYDVENALTTSKDKSIDDNNMDKLDDDGKNISTTTTTTTTTIPREEVVVVPSAALSIEDENDSIMSNNGYGSLILLNKDDNYNPSIFRCSRMKSEVLELNHDSKEQQQKNRQRHRVADALCSICLLQFEQDDIVAWSNNSNKNDITNDTNDLTTSLLCNHVYHKDCIIPWLMKHNDCPNCRQTYFSNITGSEEQPVTIQEEEGESNW